MRAAVLALNLANLATTTRTEVGKHARPAAAETANLLTRTTTRKIVANATHIHPPFRRGCRFFPSPGGVSPYQGAGAAWSSRSS